MDDILNKVHMILLDNFSLDAEDIKSNSLIDDGLIDSFDIVILVENLEQNFDIEIPGEQIIRSNFNSLIAITNLIISIQQH